MFVLRSVYTWLPGEMTGQVSAELESIFSASYL